MSAHSLLGRLTAVALAGAVLRVVLLLLLIPPFGVTGAAWAAAIAICVDQGATLVMALRHLHVRFRAFVTHIVRPVIAACFMACAVLAIAMRLPDGEITAPLVSEIAVGAIVYTIVLLVTWLLTGRPDGPEADAVTAIRRIIGRA